jgi:hypothetical protein
MYFQGLFDEIFFSYTQKISAGIRFCVSLGFVYFWEWCALFLLSIGMVLSFFPKKYFFCDILLASAVLNVVAETDWDSV